MMVVLLVRCAGFHARSCKEDKFFRLLLCIPYLFTACFTKTGWRWEFLGVLAFSFESHKNFNRPLGETPALSYLELVSGWNYEHRKVSLPTETICGALNHHPYSPRTKDL